MLGFFKYSEFLAHNLNQLLPAAPLPEVHQALPLGISFFTFQLVSYVVDVYRGAVKVERDLDPVRRLHPDVPAPDRRADRALRRHPRRDARRPAQDRPHRPGRPVLHRRPLPEGAGRQHRGAAGRPRLRRWTWRTSTRPPPGSGVWAYTLQIYFDFCGYSNMAIGLAFLLGFTFPKNFDYPYVAAVDHRVLAALAHEPVVLVPRLRLHPAGRQPARRWRKTVRNLLIVFFLTGLWHGAAWRFIVWGLYHGALPDAGAVRPGPAAGARAAAAAPRLRGAGGDGRLGVLPRRQPAAGAAATWRRWPSPRGFAAAGRRAVDPAERPDAGGAGRRGRCFAVPLLPALLAAAARARAEPPRPDLPARLDTRSVHALPIPLLAAGFVLSRRDPGRARRLNPFLYFRF